MHVLVEVDHERDLTRQTGESEVQQPPPVVGLDAEAFSRGEKSAGCAGTRDPWSLTRVRPISPVSSFFSWAPAPEIRINRDPRIAAKKLCASFPLPAKFP